MFLAAFADELIKVGGAGMVAKKLLQEALPHVIIAGGLGALGAGASAVAGGGKESMIAAGLGVPLGVLLGGALGKDVGFRYKHGIGSLADHARTGGMIGAGLGGLGYGVAGHHLGKKLHHEEPAK